MIVRLVADMQNQLFCRRHGSGSSGSGRLRYARYSDYILWPDITGMARQDAVPGESYGNFGLDMRRPPSRRRITARFTD